MRVLIVGTERVKEVALLEGPLNGKDKHNRPRCCFRESISEIVVEKGTRFGGLVTEWAKAQEEEIPVKEVGAVSTDDFKQVVIFSYPNVFGDADPKLEELENLSRNFAESGASVLIILLNPHSDLAPVK